MQNLHEYREGYKADAEQLPCIGRNPSLDLRGHERKVLGTLDEEEIYDCSGCNASEEAYFPFEVLLVVEGENQPADIFDDKSEEEGEGH